MAIAIIFDGVLTMESDPIREVESADVRAWNLLCERLQRDPATSEEGDTCSLRAAWKAMLAFAAFQSPPVAGGSVGEDRCTRCGAPWAAASDGRCGVCAKDGMPQRTIATPSAVLDRDAIARIIDPVSFGGGVNYSPRRAREALAKADAILALAPDKAPSAVGGVDRMREALATSHRLLRATHIGRGTRGGSCSLCGVNWNGEAEQHRDDCQIAENEAALATGETSPEKGAGE